MIKDQRSRIEDAASLIKNASYPVAFSGAGISTPSGIPDFRSPEEGLWEKQDAYEVSSLSSFRRDPKKFYNWIIPLYQQSISAKPNPAHTYLSRMQSEGYIQSIITQNIDGLHQASGSRNVIELHGTAKTATCIYCQKQHKTGDLFEIFQNEKTIPKCLNCGNIIKPDVILFEEMLPEKAWHNAHSEMLKADLVVVIGSSLEVYPANSLPEIAIRNHAKLIINTLSKTPLDRFADILLNMDVAYAIPEIYKILVN